MGTFLATSLFAVPLVTWMSGIFLAQGPQLSSARNLLRAARDLPCFPELLFFRSRHAAIFPEERRAVDEVSR